MYFTLDLFDEQFLILLSLIYMQKFIINSIIIKTKLKLNYRKYMILVKTKSLCGTFFSDKLCKYCVAIEYNFGLLFKNGKLKHSWSMLHMIGFHWFIFKIKIDSTF